MLVTVRHPGPATAVEAVLPALRDHCDVVILATGPAAARFATRPADCETWGPHPHQVRFEAPIRPAPAGGIDPGWTTVIDPSDTAGCAQLLRAVRAVIAEVRPDVVLRTTPSEGIGIDEVLATAAAPIPTVAFQDFYGLGWGLGPGEHPVADTPAARVLVVDEAAADMVERHASVPSTVVGWAHLAHVATWPQHERLRSQHHRSGRRQVGIIGAAVDEPVSEVHRFSPIAEAYVAAGALVAYRPHPRTPARIAADIQARLPRGDHGAQLAGTVQAALAAVDVVISDSSILNLEAMAYVSTDAAAVTDPWAGTTSAYLNRGTFDLGATGWIHQPPPTHDADRGSEIFAGDDPTEAVAHTLDAGRRLRRREEAASYAPGPNTLRAFVDALLGEAR